MRSNAPSEPRLGLTVLVVDDDEVNRFMTVERVKQLGYDVVTAANGEQAVAVALAGSLAAVLMDCQMPILDGYAATRRIRASEAPGNRLPIIALTAHAVASERGKVLAAGMDDYLTKPIRIEALRRALDRFARKLDVSRSPAWPEPDDSQHELSDAVRRSTKVVELFLRLVPGQLAALREAAAGGDEAQLRAQAHKLKGTCASIGAARMAQRCESLQRACDAGSAPNALDAVAEIEARFAAVRERLQAELAGKG